MITTERLLSTQDVEFFGKHGYLRVPAVFNQPETDELAAELDRLMVTWATRDQGWTGAWRKALMDEQTEKKSQLVALHDLEQYSAAWARAISHPRMAAVLTALLGPDVEFHHTTMHVKPPETGHPFPTHQDHAFYPHADDRYVDVLVHLDDTNAANGEIRFMDASHAQGPLEHIEETVDGKCTPYLPFGRYRLEDTVAVPAKRGDIVVFNINTIHGSYINTTDRDRRLVRVGYRHPGNRQLSGQHFGRPGFMLSGVRTREHMR